MQLWIRVIHHKRQLCARIGDTSVTVGMAWLEKREGKKGFDHVVVNRTNLRGNAVCSQQREVIGRAIRAQTKLLEQGAYWARS